jgi:hypothetical protein
MKLTFSEVTVPLGDKGFARLRDAGFYIFGAGTPRRDALNGLTRLFFVDRLSLP